MSHLYFNEESDNSEENTCDNEVFRPTILHHRKKLNIFTLQKSRLVQMGALEKRSERNKL